MALQPVRMTFITVPGSEALTDHDSLEPSSSASALSGIVFRDLNFTVVMKLLD